MFLISLFRSNNLYSLKEEEQKANDTINKTATICWGITDLVLFFAYIVECIKKGLTVEYVITFSFVLLIPFIISAVLYFAKVKPKIVQYFIVIGYMIMYCFVLFTATTETVYVYILPMISIIILYREEMLIYTLGGITLLLNAIDCIRDYHLGMITLANSKDYEIRFACILMCCIYCLFATRIYKKLTDKNTKYIQQLQLDADREQQFMFQSITTIANAIDAKDSYTKGHSTRVAEYSRRLAMKLGMSTEEAQNIHRVALLHDIGKIAIPDSILNKPGKLTDEEYEIVKKHPEYGAKILKDINSTISDIVVGALYHHERYDGKGYPQGLKGEEIPYTARIIGVADAFDAMNSTRIYREKLSTDYILYELEKNKGKQFDPEIAQAMIDLIYSGLSTEVIEDVSIIDSKLPMDKIIAQKEEEE